MIVKDLQTAAERRDTSMASHAGCDKMVP